HTREQIGNVSYKLTTGGGEATLITRQALKEGNEMIISVGGDGTADLKAPVRLFPNRFNQCFRGASGAPRKIQTYNSLRDGALLTYE
ncbi:MAG: hypothetical protein KJ919_04880, partial [Verrucomicrobia bacterium]|nr:hypothetical protein [Verrucomicrobiota bacterium]